MRNSLCMLTAVRLSTEYRQVGCLSNGTYHAYVLYVTHLPSLAAKLTSDFAELGTLQAPKILPLEIALGTISGLQHAVHRVQL